MAGLTHRPFRELCREAGGCAAAVLPMISASGLHFPSSRSKTYGLIDNRGEASPRWLQIFGNDPLEMAEAAQIAARNGAEIIDLNFGCQIPKIIKNDSGVALLRDFSRLTAIVVACLKAVDIPITVKLRLGWDNFTILPLVRILSSLGISAICVHSRTAMQQFSGTCRHDVWPYIVKAAGSVPVIANGDIDSLQDILPLLKAGCRGIMIGRAALRNPHIFRRLNAGNNEQKVARREAVEMALRHLQLCELYGKDELQSVRRLRSHFIYQNLPEQAALMAADSFAQLREIMQAIDLS